MTTTSQAEHKKHNSEISLAEVLVILLKYKLLIIGVSVTCAFFVGLHTAKTPQEYEAETLILISPGIVNSKESDEASAQIAEVTFSTLEASTYGILALSDELVVTLADTLFSRFPDDKLKKLGIADAHAMISVLKKGMQKELLQKKDIKDSSSPLLKLQFISEKIDLPLTVVNSWAELFLQRNQGLSSNVTDDFYRNVESQYEQAKNNLERSEDELAKVSASSNELNRLNTELTFKDSTLEKTLKNYQQFQSEITEKTEDYAFVTNYINEVENSSKTWIGYLNPTDPYLKTVESDHAKSIQNLIYQIATLDQDSTTIETSYQRKFEEMDSRHQIAIATFEQETQLSLKELQEIDLREDLQQHRTEIATTKRKIEDLNSRLTVIQELLNEEKPVINISKAITDDALWKHTGADGNFKKESQEDLGAFRLISEEINPVYTDLKQQLVTVKNDLLYLQNRNTFFNNNIHSVEQQYKDLNRELLSLRKEQYALTSSLEKERTTVQQQYKRENSDTSLRLQLKRKAFESYRAEYEENKTQQEKLRQELLSLKNSYSYNEKNYQKWREELISISMKVDYLSLNKRRLERDIEVYTQSFNRLAKLREEARIARQQAAGDIQVVSKAKLIKPIPNPFIPKAVATFAIAFFTLILLVLLYEAVTTSKKNTLEKSKLTHSN